MMETDSGSRSEARQILLEQKKIQDAIAAVSQYIPSILYVLTSFVYSPVIFIVRDTLHTSVWIAFSTQIVAIWLVFSLRAIVARRAQAVYEMIALKRPSDPHSTDEMIWADRLAELRQYTRSRQYFVWLATIEPVLWLAFAGLVVFLARL